MLLNVFGQCEATEMELCEEGNAAEVKEQNGGGKKLFLFFSAVATCELSHENPQHQGKKKSNINDFKQQL